MNKLSIDEKVRVVACLVEGNSLRSTVRMKGIHRTTMQKLMEAGVSDHVWTIEEIVGLLP